MSVQKWPLLVAFDIDVALIAPKQLSIINSDLGGGVLTPPSCSSCGTAQVRCQALPTGGVNPTLWHLWCIVLNTAPSAGNWDLALYPNKVDARQNSGEQGTDRIRTLLSNTVPQASELHKCDTQHRPLLTPNHKAVVSIPTEGFDFVYADNIDDFPKVNFIFIVLVQMQLNGFHLVQRCVLDTVKNTSASFAERGPWWGSSSDCMHLI